MKRDLVELVAGIEQVTVTRTTDGGVVQSYFTARSLPDGKLIKVNPFAYERFDDIQFMDLPMYKLKKVIK